MVKVDRWQRFMGFDPDEPLHERLAGAFNSPAFMGSIGLMTGGLPGMAQGLQTGQKSAQEEYFRTQAAKLQQQQAQAQQPQPHQPQPTQPYSLGVDTNFRQGGTPQTPAMSSHTGSGAPSTSKQRELATLMTVHGNQQQQLMGANMLNQLEQQSELGPAQEAARQKWQADKLFELQKIRMKHKHEFDKLRFGASQQRGLAMFKSKAQDQRLGRELSSRESIAKEQTQASNYRMHFAEDGRRSRHRQTMSMAQSRLDHDTLKQKAKRLSEIKQEYANIEQLMGTFGDATRAVGSGWGGFSGRAVANMGFMGLGQPQRDLHRMSNSVILDLVGKIPGHLSNKDLKFLQESVPHYTDDDEDWYTYIGKGYRGVYNAMLQAAKKARDAGDQDLAEHYMKLSDRARVMGQALSAPHRTYYGFSHPGFQWDNLPKDYYR